MGTGPLSPRSLIRRPAILMSMHREAIFDMLTRIFLLLTAVSVFMPATARAEEKVNYETQIQPIFMQHCAGCHGEKKASAKMRLHTVAGIQEKWKAESRTDRRRRAGEERTVPAARAAGRRQEADAEEGRPAAQGNDRPDRQVD